MYLPDTQPSYIDEVIEKLQGLTESLLIGLTPCGDDITLNETEDLYQHTSSENIYVIKQGVLHCSYHDRLIYFYEAGDLIGILNALHLPPPTLSSESDCVLRPYKLSDLHAHINNDVEKQSQWSALLASYSSIFMVAFARYTNKTNRSTPGFLHFKAGDTIIKEGDDADNVYTILEGEAEAIKDGVKVGDIKKEEIFGAMAVLTREKRSANVVAKTPCSVIAVPKDQFIDLIEYQPRTCLAVIENLVDKINALNDMVLDLQSEK